jgi:hypothetical protein
MSKSIHITIKNFKGLTKKQLAEQFIDPDSDLAKWGKKSGIKSKVKKSRKQKKILRKINKDSN